MKNLLPRPALGAIGLLITALSAGLAGPVLAHHSFAMYDADTMLTLKGVVQEFYWTNPHASLIVIVQPQGDKPPQTWNLEMTSPGNLTRAGWTKRQFKPGDRIEVSFHPLRSGETGGNFDSATSLETGVKTPRVSASNVNSKPAGLK